MILCRKASRFLSWCLTNDSFILFAEVPIRSHSNVTKNLNRLYMLFEIKKFDTGLRHFWVDENVVFDTQSRFMVVLGLTIQAEWT